MNALSAMLKRETEEREKVFFSQEDKTAPYRLTHHLMPPAGWMNDPNGLCFYKGRYHVFFQYAPFSPEGGLKLWGHYTSGDMRDWRYEGAAILPDSPEDCHGAYSGSAVAAAGALHVFYTGNVKLEDKAYDYILDGRRSSTIYAASRDGVHFGPKTVVLEAEDYPREYTCHVRDPKVWVEEGIWRMVLGGRRRGDQGGILLYEGKDPKRWRLRGELTTQEPFGYMWECPDFFVLEGQRVLSVSPQGLSHEEYRFQNLYQSGYFFLEEGWEEQWIPQNFQEWDMGFDFYAPQTFLDGKGRRLLMAWMGMPAEEQAYGNPTLDEGWQHCMTVPRELRLRAGRIYQYPPEELKGLRGRERRLEACGAAVQGPFDLELSLKGGPLTLCLGGELFLKYREGCADLCLSERAGRGRKRRRARIPSGSLESLRMLADTSAVEIYLNQGEVVFSTRYYPEGGSRELQVQAQDYEGRLWELRPMRVTRGREEKIHSQKGE